MGIRAPLPELFRASFYFVTPKPLRSAGLLVDEVDAVLRLAPRRPSVWSARGTGLGREEAVRLGNRAAADTRSRFDKLASVTKASGLGDRHLIDWGL